MKRCGRVRVEEWRGVDHSEKECAVSSDDELAEIIRAIAASESAMIEAEINGNILVIAASNGMYTVSVLLVDGDAYSLLSSDSEEGTAHFIEGGQSVDMARRQVVSEREATAVLSRFLFGADLDLRERWEKQQ